MGMALLSAKSATVPNTQDLLRDCIYFNGQEEQYYAQFYEPCSHYNAPVLAVPGKHDGSPIDASQGTLDGFLANFCTVAPSGTAQAG